MNDELTADALLDAVQRLWQQLDPPPPDLAEGVLARLEAEQLDVELLTLVEQEEPAGVRSVSAVPDEDTGTWSLEYAGSDFRVNLRIAKGEGVARLDGWVVPARPLTVRISTERPYRILQQTEVDWRGRFEFVGSPTGLCRLYFLDPESPGEHRPQATPPFWI